MIDCSPWTGRWSKSISNFRFCLYVTPHDQKNSAILWQHRFTSAFKFQANPPLRSGLNQAWWLWQDKSPKSIFSVILPTLNGRQQFHESDPSHLTFLYKISSVSVRVCWSHSGKKQIFNDRNVRRNLWYKNNNSQGVQLTALLVCAASCTVYKRAPVAVHQHTIGAMVIQWSGSCFTEALLQRTQPAVTVVTTVRRRQLVNSLSQRSIAA